MKGTNVTADVSWGTARPLVSFAVPVRNAERYLGRALDSVLAQDLPDLEVVISDNDSTDSTPELCRSYAADDERVHYHRLPRNIGQIANFNRVLELSRGVYVRWLGSDDWLEPTYASRCVAAMDDDPDAVLVTTRQTFVDDDGSELAASDPPEGPQGADPVARMGEMLRLLNESHLLIDPIYSMMRRSLVERTGRLRHETFTDQILAVELSILGPFNHVPETLSYRRQADRFLRPTEKAQRYGVCRGRTVTRTLQLCRYAANFAANQDLDAEQQRRALALIARFYARRHAQTTQRRWRRLREGAISVRGETTDTSQPRSSDSQP